MLRRIALVAVLFASALPVLLFFGREGASGHLHAGELAARPIADGVELLVAELFRGDQRAGRLYAFFLEPGAAIPELAINQDAGSLAAVAPDAFLVVNAGFFTPERRATGLLVSRGKTLSPFVPEGGAAGSGVFVLEGGVPSLVPRDQAGGRSFAGAELALQAGPRIIEPDGSPGIRGDDGQRANRTVIGADAKGRVVIAVVVGPAGWSTGPTLFELQRVLRRELALSFALNLDGGPSTGMYLRGEPRIELPESAPVHSVLAWRRRP